MPEQFSLDGKQMRVVSTAENGVVNKETLFTFSQNNDLVSAQYSGGQVRLGYLVGVLSSNKLHFRYAQVDNAGNLDGGSSVCDLEIMNDGKIRLLEHFSWETREGVGTNIFEEVRD